MLLYSVFGAMFVLAAIFVAVPLLRASDRVPVVPVATVALVLLMSLGLYARIGSPGADSSMPQTLPDVGEMVASLAARLEDNPDDLDGWKMLGRSNVQMQDYPAAIRAFERAVELEGARNGQTLADLGEVMLLSDASALHGRAGQLFDNALALEPNNQKALFYAGMAAVQRGDRELGATHWEALLRTSPPENIATILREQIAQLRGQPVEAAPPARPAESAFLTASVSLSDPAAAAVPADATVFIIARDPAQPSPPIAAVRRKVSELPSDVRIGDADAMIPGRVPSGFAKLELVARVSMSGQPIEQSGDWFGQLTVTTSGSSDIAIVIDQQVP